MVEAILLNIKLDKEDSSYMLSETISGRLLLSNVSKFQINEIGVKVFLDDGDKDVLITKEVFSEGIPGTPVDTVLHFNFGGELFESFAREGEDLRIVLEPYLFSNSNSRIFLWEKKLHLTSNKVYKIMYDELRVGIPLNPLPFNPLLLILPVVILQLFFNTILISSILLIALATFVVVYLGIYLSIGRLHFDTIPIDEKSFNIISDNTRIWKFIKEIRIWYDVVKVDRVHVGGPAIYDPKKQCAREKTDFPFF